MVRLSLLAFGLVAAWMSAATAQQAPQSDDYEALVEGPHSTHAIGDPRAVFAVVLRGLPERVNVLPTENYFYFRFVLAGRTYSGNIRLAAADRDQGKLYFAYGPRPSERNRDPAVKHVVFDAAHGVKVERLAPLAYRVSFADKAVTFALNELSQMKPPLGLLTPDETLLGPIYDESAVRFFLVVNSRLKVFHYLLAETAAPAEQWRAAKSTDRIVIGRRSGFAFYRDENRKILIGALKRNSRLNNAFDGPFDQLPENFIDGEALRQAILAADRGMNGRIDRLGNFADGSGRYLIHPYLLYRREADLAVFHRCVTSRSVAASERPRCFVIDDDEANRIHPRPLALKRR